MMSLVTTFIAVITETTFDLKSQTNLIAIYYNFFEVFTTFYPQRPVLYYTIA